MLAVWTLACGGGAALLGATLGAAWDAAGIAHVPPVGAAAAVGVAGLLDLAGVVAPSIRRQVPIAWGRILDPRLTAVLYGVRLGIGPATMLSTWLWWAATLVSASHGTLAGAAVGAAFAGTRTLVNVAVAARVDRLPAWHRRGGTVTRALELGALALGMVVLLAACSGDDDGTPPTTASTSEAPPGTTAPPSTTEDEVDTTTTTEPEPDLAAELPAGLPGYEPITDRPGAEGPLDLEAAVAGEVDPEAERTLLETRGFQEGYTRAWRDDRENVVVATVYRFATPEDAALYLQDGLITLEGFAASPFEVPEVEGARGFSQPDPGGELVTHGVAFVRSDRWYLVYVNGPPEAATTDEVRRLAVAVSSTASP